MLLPVLSSSLPVVTFCFPVVSSSLSVFSSFVSSVSSFSFPAPPVYSLSFANPAASSALPPSGFPGDSWSSPGLGAGVDPSSSTCLSGPRLSVGDCRGTSFSFSDVDPTFDKGDKELPLAKGEFSKSFQEMIYLITSYFPACKPSVSSKSDSLIPWLDVFGNICWQFPRVFLSLFEKWAAISKEVDDKFLKATDEKKKSSFSLPYWSEVYRLGNLDKFHKAPQVNESFSHLLSKTVSSSCFVSLSLDDTAKLNSCIRGQIESQSFSLWALALVFEFLRESNCVPDSPVFHQLFSSMTSAINAQACASFSAVTFLKQICRDTLVSHVLSSTHASVKHALMSSPTSSLFSEDAVKASLSQVKEDSQLTLLLNLSFKKDGKRTDSSPSSSVRSRSSSSSSSQWSSHGARGTKRPASPSPSRRRVSFDSKVLRSPTPKNSSFSK